MCQQMVRQEHGLGVLEVCPTWHCRAEVPAGLLDQGVDQI